jgi:glycine/D-amino acid oxidase-like deaminating enzyme/nitrite reductase/ring-hydroxylating ferredoxin subunit
VSSQAAAPDEALPGRPLPLWLDEPEIGGRTRPALDGDRRAEVAVVGAGITGLTTALLLASAGRSVILVELEHIGFGSSGANTGKASSQHGEHYAPLTNRYGPDAARIYGTANEKAIDLIEGFVSDGAIECDFRRRDSYLYAAEPGERTKVEAEARAAKAAGLPAELTRDVPLPFATHGAVRFSDQSEFHPQKYLHGLARMLEAAGGEIFEGTRATGVSERGSPVLETEVGRIEADHVVVATLMPFLDRGAFFTRAHPFRSYVISAEAEGSPEAMFLSIGSTTRSIRSQPWRGRELLLVGGEGHKVGSSDADPDRYEALAAFARMHWAVDSFEHRWSAQDFMAVDGVPFVGPLHPFNKRIWIATGLNKWGLSGGTVAARLICDGIQSSGGDEETAKLFSSLRVSLRGQGPKFMTENSKVGLHMVGDRLRERGGRQIADLEPGEGAIVSGPSGKVAGYRDPEGRLHAVSARCTHLGCQVRWNGADASWDCPCHGSRFGVDGELLDGPAVHPLEPRPTGEESDGAR